MIAFTVNDMSCGHCVSAITQALKAVDPDARVRFDLAAHRVDIDAGHAGVDELRDAIQAAGYTPVLAADPAPRAAVARGGCCGCCGR